MWRANPRVSPTTSQLPPSGSKRCLTAATIQVPHVAGISPVVARKLMAFRSQSIEREGDPPLSQHCRSRSRSHRNTSADYVRMVVKQKATNLHQPVDPFVISGFKPAA